MKKKFTKAKEKLARLFRKLRPSRQARSPISPNSNSNANPAVDPPSLHAGEGPNEDLVITASTNIEELLTSARGASDVCPPLKAALAGAGKTFGICEVISKGSDRYTHLGRRVAHLGAISGALSARGQLDPNLLRRLGLISELFSHLTVSIERKLRLHTIRALVESRVDVAEIDRLLLTISMRIEAFIYESVVSTRIDEEAFFAMLPCREKEELEREIARWRAAKRMIREGLDALPLRTAGHNLQARSAGCMSGTRVEELSKLVHWVKTNPGNVLRIAGAAGMGKTSIAVSLCRMLQEDPDVLPGGTFFCSRAANGELRTDVKRIFPTLSALLSDQSPKFASELATGVKPTAAAVAHKSAREQIGPLLQRPLAALSLETRPIVFFIEALDECSNQSEVSELLDTITAFRCPANVKFMLTSRPETYILSGPTPSHAQSIAQQMHQIGAENTTEDIFMYIDRSFAEHSRDAIASWYSGADVQALVTLSNGLFSFASTVIAYIVDNEDPGVRASRLRLVLSTIKESKAATWTLDRLYDLVLTGALGAPKVEPQELATLREALACILSTRASLSVKALADLVRREEYALYGSLRRIRAVLHVPDQPYQSGLRTLHASFEDYLFERAGPGVRIDRTLGDTIFARGCLQVMAERLHFNVSESRSSYLLNQSVISANVTLALQYACLHWIYHVANLPEKSAFDLDIGNAFCPRILFWLEVVSVLTQVQRAATMLGFAAATVQSAQLSRFFRDAREFVTSSHRAIERSAPLIYLAALPFSAKESMVYKMFIPLYTGLVSVNTYDIPRQTVHGRAQPELLPSPHDYAVRSIAVSPDGTIIVSGCEQGSVRVWDARTGQPITPPLLGHTRPVYSVAFSFDGRRIASASGDQSVRLCTQWTKFLISGQIYEHKRDVNSLAFSSDMLWLASGSDDATVRVWNVLTRLPWDFGPLLCGRRIFAVAFSPDSRLLAAGDSDGRIHLWRTETGRPVYEPLLVHTRCIRSLRFSPDGERIVSGGEDRAVRVSNVTTGRQMLNLGGHSGLVYSVAHSQDGRLIASGADDARIFIWDAETGSLISTLYGHGRGVSCVTFAPDGQSIVSCSLDATIRVWNIDSARYMSSNNSGGTKGAMTTGGWLSGPSGEDLMWMPARPHGHIQMNPCAMIIGARRVVITPNSEELYCGENWTSCWSGAMPAGVLQDSSGVGVSRRLG